MDNSLKFLTTKRERRLVRMQADRNVIQLKSNEKSLIMSQKAKSHAEISKLHGDSSAFESDDFVPFLD